MTYLKKFFDINARQSEDMPQMSSSDQKDAKLYIFDRGADRSADKNDQANPAVDVELAVNVALSAERPLLVLGKSGQGKSSLAAAVAWRMGWRFLRTIVTARTTAEDMLWQVDAVARLADAQLKDLKPDIRFYLDPGPLWWALDPRQARLRGLSEEEVNRWAAETAKAVQPAKPPGNVDAGPLFDDRRAVLLIDEIDKADPDVPNALLGPLGNWRFDVRPTGAEVTLPEGRPPPLVVLTSNDERALPAAFVRRCVVIRLNEANKDTLISIAKSHYRDADDSLLERIAEKAVSEKDHEDSILVSPAEVLNAVKACLDLGVKDGPHLDSLLSFALSKQHARG